MPVNMVCAESADREGVWSVLLKAAPNWPSPQRAGGMVNFAYPTSQARNLQSRHAPDPRENMAPPLPPYLAERQKMPVSKSVMPS